MHTNLHSLPTEIIQHVSDYLPVSALVSLKLASKTIFVKLRSRTQGYIKTASSCEVKAIRRFVSERQIALGGRRKCILCDGLMPVTFFHDASLPVCKWHQGWFNRSVSGLSAVASSDMRPVDIFSGSVGIDRVLCGHCKTIRGWDVAHCSCKTHDGCESCGTWGVTCIVST